jgi:hypothetical protein
MPSSEITLPLADIARRFQDSHNDYISAKPFAHGIFDQFLPDEWVNGLVSEFPKIDSADWINYRHFNQKKFGLANRESLPPQLGTLIDALNSKGFLQLLSQLTGIDNLRSDPSLHGGGLHQSVAGGFLNVHADFATHSHNTHWRRRINLLIYLNPDWKEDWGGKIELWETDMSKCAAAFLPIANRCLIFNTDHTSYHGHPVPTTCPSDRTRKSIALYYYTEEAAPLAAYSTAYRYRPEDSWYKKLAIVADRGLIAVYHRLRSILHIDDAALSRWINKIRRKK